MAQQKNAAEFLKLLCTEKNSETLRNALQVIGKELIGAEATGEIEALVEDLDSIAEILNSKKFITSDRSAKGEIPTIIQAYLKPSTLHTLANPEKGNPEIKYGNLRKLIIFAINYKAACLIIDDKQTVKSTDLLPCDVISKLKDNDTVLKFRQNDVYQPELEEALSPLSLIETLDLNFDQVAQTLQLTHNALADQLGLNGAELPQILALTTGDLAKKIRELPDRPQNGAHNPIAHRGPAPHDEDADFLAALEASRLQTARDDEMRFEMARQHDFRQDIELQFGQITLLINRHALLRELKKLIEVQTRMENEKLVLDSHLERLGLDPDNVETNYDAQPNLRQAHADIRIALEVIHSILPAQIKKLKGHVLELKDAVQKVTKIAKELNNLEKIKKPFISPADNAQQKLLIEKEKNDLMKKLDADTKEICDTSRDKAIEAVKAHPGNLTKAQSIMKDAQDFLSSIPARAAEIQNHEANLLNAFKTDPKIGDRLVKLFNDKLKLQEQKKYLEEAIDKDIEAVFNDASREAQNSVLAHPEDLSLVGRSLTVLERFFATLPARQKDIEEINRKTNELQNNYDESIAQILQFNDDFARQEWQKSEKTKEMATGLKDASKIFSDFLQKNVNIPSHKCEDLAHYFATHTCDNDAAVIEAGQYLIDFSVVNYH